MRRVQTAVRRRVSLSLPSAFFAKSADLPTQLMHNISTIPAPGGAADLLSSKPFHVIY